MRHSVTRANETHLLDLVQSWRDEFGIFWHVFRCPTCGRETQVSLQGKLTLDPGTDAMSEQTRELVIQMHHGGRHREADKLVASYPGHKYEVPGFSGGIGPVKWTGQE